MPTYVNKKLVLPLSRQHFFIGAILVCMKTQQQKKDAQKEPKPMVHDPKTAKKDFALKHQPDLKPKGKRAK